MSKDGRTTVYNEITSDEKMAQVCRENIALEEDFLEYLVSTDRAKSTIVQYRALLHILWCWNLDENNNIPFTQMTKRQVARFQNKAINEWGWSPNRIRMAKSVYRSLENYIENILDDEYPNYKKIWNKIESPSVEPVRQKSIFTQDEMQNLLDYLVAHDDLKQACWLALAMYSGRRKSELVRFKVSYFDKRNLICKGSLYKTPEKVTTKGRGTRGKLLYIYTLAKPFQPYLDLWMERREELGIETEYLFPAYKDGKYVNEPLPVSTTSSWSNKFSRVLGRPWYPHSMRHFFTTMLSQQGIPDKVIKDIVGWSSVALVDVYRDTDAEDAFEQYFGEEGFKKVKEKDLSSL